MNRTLHGRHNGASALFRFAMLLRSFVSPLAGMTLLTALAGCASTAPSSSPALHVDVPAVAHPQGESPQWWYRNGAAKAAAQGAMQGKAKNVIETCRLLVEKHGSQVPDNREDLEALPGVGRKTANVVLNMWFHYPAQAVDTHIFRIGNRTGICPGKDVDAVERAIEDNVPVEFQQHAHHWLILHGRYICTARKPRCADCLIRDLCAFEEKTA